ncbi:M15 family metallopeptidase domain-containing protein [Jiella pelagia]|uniref:Peptidase M15C domain-containing protein n=1 Tax=Jiella pelagia TaxID=2986949 RepID=A0ABY7BYX6_9HYPH|nr:hypothetical protein [Jiella pelagia]WAP69029.1 hypothetical protein OH818_01445 [Jiella pelagia]
MKYVWSRKSLFLLNQLHPDLRRVVFRAFSYDVMDITVLQTLRMLEEQKANLAKGVSATLKSKHLMQPSGYAHAVDLAPYPIDWNDTKRYGVMMGLMAAAAKEEGVNMRMGGNWDGDNDFRDNKPEDPGHFELA